MDVHLKIMTGVENVLSKKTHFLRLADGHVDAFLGEGVFTADIDVALVGTDCISGDDHRFEDGMRVALQDQAVLEGARFTLIRIADDIFLFALSFGDKFPFGAGREAGSTAPTQAGLFQFGDDLFRFHGG